MASSEILLLEDNDHDVLLLREALAENRLECNIRSFADGEEILTEIRSNARSGQFPDLILLDLNLPRMEGLDALNEIRAIPEMATTPVVILTSSGFTQDRVSAAVAGADSYIQKPVSYEGYLNEVGPAIRDLLANRPVS